MSELRFGTLITVGDLEIEPIERVVVRVDRVGAGIVGVALKEPVALILRSPAGTWRLDVEDARSASPGGRPA
jgi:hypothetical protein